MCPALKPLDKKGPIQADMRVYASGDAELRNPITGIAGCCARAARGQAAMLAPINVMNLRRLTDYPSGPGPDLTTLEVAFCASQQNQPPDDTYGSFAPNTARVLQRRMSVAPPKAKVSHQNSSRR